MRTPIAHTMGWPQRLNSGVKPLDFCQLSNLSFRAGLYAISVPEAGDGRV